MSLTYETTHTFKPSLQERLDSGELMHFADLMLPMQNFSLDTSWGYEFDTEKRDSNLTFLKFLKQKYGDNNVISSNVNCDRYGQTWDMPGLLGVYVTSAAFEKAHLSVADFEPAATV
jgi:hypothetical protein